MYINPWKIFCQHVIITNMRDERIKTLGFNVKVERLRQKLTQAKLAELANVTGDSIQKIEAGNQTPSCLVLYDIAKALNVPLETFYKDI